MVLKLCAKKEWDSKDHRAGQTDQWSIQTKEDPIFIGVLTIILCSCWSNLKLPYFTLLIGGWLLLSEGQLGKMEQNSPINWLLIWAKYYMHLINHGSFSATWNPIPGKCYKLHRRVENFLPSHQCSIWWPMNYGNEVIQKIIGLSKVHIAL